MLAPLVPQPTAKIAPKAVDVQHPSLALYGITQIFIIGARLPQKVSAGSLGGGARRLGVHADAQHHRDEAPGQRSWRTSRAAPHAADPPSQNSAQLGPNAP
jgi:hypothetical protein